MAEPRLNPKASIYDQTYHYYLDQFGNVSFERAAPVLGGTFRKGHLIIPFFNDRYILSVDGINDASGNRPSHDICVILSKYLLLCPTDTPTGNDWVAFRNFKDAAPLSGYFTNSVEGALANHFSKRADLLKEAAAKLGGYAPQLDVRYDLAVQFEALPKVPVLMLFNDADDKFGATCSMLFLEGTEAYLDAECIAMVGSQLFYRLKKVK